MAFIPHTIASMLSTIGIGGNATPPISSAPPPPPPALPAVQANPGGAQSGSRAAAAAAGTTTGAFGTGGVPQPGTGGQKQLLGN